MKKEITANIKYKIDWLYGVTIEQIRKDLDELEKLGAEIIEIDPIENYGDPSVSILATHRRLETDAEYQSRLESEEKRKQFELKMLESLKQKYEQK